MDDGGSVSGAQSAQDSMRQAFHFKLGGRVGAKSSDVLETTKGSFPGSSGVYSQGALARSGKKHTDIGNEHGDSTHKEMGREGTREAKEVAAHKAYEISQQNPKLKGLAHGGEVDPDSEVHEMVGPEMMDAIHSKDHKKLMGCIEAMVLHHMNKKED